MGSPAAVKLKEATIVVNTDLYVTNRDIAGDSSLTSNIDPTQIFNHLQLDPQMTYVRIFGQTMKFIADNNKYIDYPKLYMNSKKPKCATKNCKQCNNKLFSCAIGCF